MKNSNNLLNQLCAEPRPGDGIDPRYLVRQDQTRPDHARHDQISQDNDKSDLRQSSRLTSEVAKVLSLLLGEMSHPKLQLMQVIDVEVQGHGQTLLINIGHYETAMSIEGAEILFELKRVRGILRSGIAQAINRRRVPALRFHYVGLMEMR